MKKLLALLLALVLVLGTFAACDDLENVFGDEETDKEEVEETPPDENDENSGNDTESGGSDTENNGGNENEDLDEEQPAQISEGLKFELDTEGKAYVLVGIGDCRDLNVVIPEIYNGLPVTSIGYEAFRNCSSLTSVTIPDSVTSIGKLAFCYCDSLTSVTIPDSVTSIGASAFYKCSSLTSVTIGNGVTSIGDEAFAYCDSLTSVTIPDSVTSIGYSAFKGCHKLVEVINKSSLNIQKGDLNGDGYDDANEHAYYALEVHGGESKIANKDGYLFYTHGEINYLLGYVGTATELTLPSVYNGENYEIYEYAFYNNDKITKVNIPDSVTNIGDDAFWRCSSLTSVTIGNGVTSIGSYAFYNCTSLTSVKLSNSVTSIGERAFSWCTSLTSVTISNGVTSIGERAFTSCVKLVEVINKSAKLTITKGSDSNGDVAYYALEVHGEESKIVNKDGYLFYTVEGVNYLVNYIGTDTELTLPENYNGADYVINDYAFYKNSKITKVTIPDSVTSIGSSAFAPCDSLTSVTIGNGVTSIGNSAFSSCDSLTSITVDESNTAYKSINGNLYSKDGKTLIKYAIGKTDTSFTIPDSVTSIGRSAFNGCDSLTSVTIDNGVTSIGDSAFAYCSSLTSVTIPNSVTSIDERAFYSCDSLTSVTIGNGVTSIGNSAFSECTSLTSVNIGNGVTSIGAYAFTSCYSLTSVTFENTTGWWYNNNANATSGTAISSTNLADTAKAATYLKSTYRSYYWKRS